MSINIAIIINNNGNKRVSNHNINTWPEHVV